MRNLDKYKGVIPAFYACYDKDGNISPEAVQALTKYFVEKGVKGVYVNGSSGECIYQSVEDRKIVLENVMKAAEGKLTVIAHVACNNTKDSQELAKHAESLGVDAIAAIPPIYFHLPEYAIAKYWNDISAAAPNTDFVIYNIPQLAGVALTQSLFAEMRKNPNVILTKKVAEWKGEQEDIWDGYHIFEEAKKGDELCNRAIDEMCDVLGKGIANICYVINPEIVVLGGGIMAQEEFLKDRIKAAMDKYLVSSIAKHTKLAFAKHQNDAGMLGAFYHFCNVRHLM